MGVSEKALKSERNIDVSVCQEWLEKFQSAKRSPFKKMDIEAKSKEIYYLFQDYIDCPVSVLIQPVKGFPWFASHQVQMVEPKIPWAMSCTEKIGTTFKTYPLHRKAVNMTYQNTKLLKLTLDPRFLNKSSEELLDLIEFILYGDKKSKQKVIENFGGPGFGKKKSNIKKWEYYEFPQGKYYDLEKIGRNVEKLYFRYFTARYRWAGKIVKSPLGTCSYKDYDEYYVILNPALDDATVPKYVLEKIIYHELLHVYDYSHGDPVWPKTSHNRTFKESEATYPKFNEANTWIRENWGNLVEQKIKENRKNSRNFS